MRKQELERACGEMGAIPSARGAGVPAFQKEGNSEQCLPVRASAVSLFQRERSGRFVLLRHQGRSWHFSSE